MITESVCTACHGQGEYDVLVGSTAWGNNGSEPIYATETCRTCNGEGVRVDTDAADRAFIRKHTPAVEVELPF